MTDHRSDADRRNQARREPEATLHYTTQLLLAAALVLADALEAKDRTAAVAAINKILDVAPAYRAAELQVVADAATPARDGAAGSSTSDGERRPLGRSFQPAATSLSPVPDNCMQAAGGEPS